jgi:hypothetical protein
MQLLKQTGNNCLITSVAMVIGAQCDEDPADVRYRLETLIGHDGTKEMWPGVPRGHHWQEILPVALSEFRCAFVPFETMPTVMSARRPNQPRPIFMEYEAQQRFDRLIHQAPGVFICSYRGAVDLHAVAWDTSHVYDPRGFETYLSYFGIQCYWQLREIAEWEHI